MLKTEVQNVQTFMDAVGDGILVVDNQGKITQLNHAACEILGYRYSKDIKNKSCLTLLGATDEKGNIINKKNAALFQSIKNGKKINNATRQFKKRDKTRIWVAITTTPLKNKKKQTKGAILVIRDITQKKQEDEYRTDFVHVASHDLRTPLGNVLWAMEYMASKKAGPLNKIQKEYIEDSFKTLKIMNALVNDLLSVSRLQNKKVKPTRQRVSVEDVLAQVLKDTKHYAKASNVRLHLTKNQKRVHYIKINKRHLTSILQNLIENAIRYSFNHTTIVLNIAKNNRQTIFSCTNKGIGIPKDKQQFIFAKFFRAKNAVNKQGNGTGLGLYITKELVKINKGKIWFESELNKQTTFFVKFKND